MKKDWNELWDTWKTGRFADLEVAVMENKSRQFTTELLRRKADCGNYDVWKSLKNQVWA
jgi:hypothetical protein